MTLVGATCLALSGKWRGNSCLGAWYRRVAAITVGSAAGAAACVVIIIRLLIAFVVIVIIIFVDGHAAWIDPRRGWSARSVGYSSDGVDEALLLDRECIARAERNHRRR